MIGKDKIFIIAEAGVNHNGDVSLAEKLIDAAKKIGADAIKFQTWKTENVVTKNSQKAPYQDEMIGSEKSQFEMLKQLELSYETFSYLKGYCDKIGIEFMSTADEWESAVFLNRIVRVIKLGSAELNDLPYLSKVASLNKEVLLSTGMANMEEVKIAVQTLKNNNLEVDKINILHAHTDYPSADEDLNLNAMITMKEVLGLNVGYSDHSVGIEIPIAVAAMGARIIEKHFTLDCSMEGPDHAASLEPLDFEKMVQAIRRVEKAMGTGIKAPSKREIMNMPFVRKSIVAKTFIRKGEEFTESNITAKRPAGGISPSEWKNIIGKTAVKDFEIDQPIIVIR